MSQVFFCCRSCLGARQEFSKHHLLVLGKWSRKRSLGFKMTHGFGRFSSTSTSSKDGFKLSGKGRRLVYTWLILIILGDQNHDKPCFPLGFSLKSMHSRGSSVPLHRSAGLREMFEGLVTSRGINHYATYAQPTCTEIRHRLMWAI